MLQKLVPTERRILEHDLRNPRPWVYPGLLLAGLLILGTFVALDQRFRSRAETVQVAREELALLAALVGPALESGRQEPALRLMTDWGGRRPEVAAIRLVSPSGIPIAEYARPEPASDALEISAPLEYRQHAQGTLSVRLERPGSPPRQVWLERQLVLLWLGVAACLAYVSLIWRREQRAAQALFEQMLAQQRANADLEAQLAAHAGAQTERDRLVAVLEATTDMVSIAEPGGRILYMNRAGRQLTGLRELNGVEQAVVQVHPDWAARKIIQEGLPTALREGSWSGETALLDGQGGEIPVSQVILAHRDARGELLFTSTIVRDISASKEAESALRASRADLDIFRRFVEGSSQAIGFASLDGRLRYVNGPLRAWIGLAPDADFSRYTFMDFYPPHDLARLDAEVLPAVQAKGQWTGELELLSRDGWLRRTLQNVFILPDEEGRPMGYANILTDITERKRIETQLQRAQFMVHNAPQEIWLSRLDGQLAYCNKAAVASLGYSAEELLGMTLADLDEEGGPDFASAAAYLKSHTTMPPFETVHRARDGRRIPKEVHATYLKLPDEEYICGFVIDLTERKRAEAALLASKTQLEEAQAITHLGSWELDLTTGRANWSKEMFRLLGYEPDTVEAHVERFMARVHPDDRERVSSEMQAATSRPNGGYGIEHRVLLPDREERILLERGYVTFDVEGKPQRMLGTSLDVTTLWQSERRLAESQRIARIGTWDLDLVNERLVWSDEIYRIFEIAPRHRPASYALFLSRVHPDDREGVNLAYRRSVSERKPYAIVHRLLLPDGRIKYVHEQGETTYDEQGRAIRSLGTAQDVTDLKLAEEKLREYRDHLEALVAKRTRQVREQALVIDQIHDAVVTTDMDCLVTSWNAGAERLFGYPAQEAVGRPISLVYLPDDHAFLDAEVIQPLLENGAHEIEVRMRRRDGVPFDAHLSLSLLYDEQGAPRGMVGYSIDISARKQAESLLREKSLALEAANRELESFSYSVSHDLRAPLRGIDGFSQALLEDYGDQLPEEAHDYLRRIRGGAQRMGGLIDDLLRLSRVSRVEMAPATVDLSAVATSILQERARQEPERRVITSVAPGLAVRADPGLMQILLENLLGNAWKYTAKTETARIELAAERLDGHSVYVVRDNGAGFDMQYADKLFGAFQRLHHPRDFSGTGIGLATAQRIVHRHGGRIWVEAKVGRGAVFRFVLGSPTPLT